MLPKLDDLIQYQHQPVIASYRRNYPEQADRAEDLFQSMLKYLWVSQKHGDERRRSPDDPALDFVLVMHEEMRAIDNMWHNFILYTQDYTEFCHSYFGEYLHHQPDMALIQTHPQSEFAVLMEKYLLYLFENLGEETVTHWFGEHL
ncbi:MAG: hypothetical protein HYR96_01085 [Deltaproteobacteria bacterium]|nr:hypothetical protein [Deltaproteobacteria bacterium]MBI3296066.1 hypothetical protein [Deltaproteobacteria bacterium]